MSTTLQRRTRGAVTSASVKTQKLNAETVTTIATSFLKRIGHKSGVKPKRVTLEEGAYIVEIDMKKSWLSFELMLRLMKSRSMKYSQKAKKRLLFPFHQKSSTVTFGISAVVYVALNFAFQMFGI